MTHTSFATSTRGRNRDLPAMRQYPHGAKLIVREFPGQVVESHASQLEQVIRMARAGELPQAMQVCALFLGLAQLGRIC